MPNMPFEMSDAMKEALLKLNKSLLEDFEKNSIFGSFNRKVAEDLKGKQSRTGQCRPEWKTVNEAAFENTRDGIWNLCLECGESLMLHKNGKCPVIVDAKFIEEEQPQLPSGKENKNGKR